MMISNQIFDLSSANGGLKQFEGRFQSHVKPALIFKFKDPTWPCVWPTLLIMYAIVLNRFVEHSHDIQRNKWEFLFSLTVLSASKSSSDQSNLEV